MSSTTTIICPHCLVSNRVPDDKLSDSPNCGKCHKSLFTGSPLALDANSFNTFINKNQTPVIVDFWAEWCGPCKQMAPAFAQAAAELEPDFRLCKLDTEQHQAVAGQFNIRGIPCLIMFQNGKEIARQAGMMPTASIVEWVRQSSPLA